MTAVLSSFRSHFLKRPWILLCSVVFFCGLLIPRLSFLARKNLLNPTTVESDEFRSQPVSEELFPILASSDDPGRFLGLYWLETRFQADRGCDSTFLYYILANDAFFNYASATSKGTKMPRGDKTAIMQYKVPCFNYETQLRIGKLLRSIDDRIAVNKKINDNLEQQAQAIYHERFETVSPNDLPSDWRIVTLGEVATISNKSFNPLKEPEILLEHYSIPAFDEARFPVFELSTSIKSNKFIIDASCFMISKLNPTTKRVWKPYCLTGNAVCSTEFIVYKAKDQSITDFLYSVIDSGSFSDFMCSHVTGSTGSRQRTTPSDTLSYELILPSEDELAEFQSLVSPMYAQMRINAIENDKLKRLRDSLLPKLMSGEIDVSSVHL